MDDSLITDPAVLAWNQMLYLRENGAPESEIDRAFRQYLAAVEEQMKRKEHQ